VHARASIARVDNSGRRDQIAGELFDFASNATGFSGMPIEKLPLLIFTHTQRERERGEGGEEEKIYSAVCYPIFFFFSSTFIHEWQ
jgi:hypothetical protein